MNDIQVFSTDVLINTLLPTLIALKNDQDWRVRQGLLQYFPLLSEQLGSEMMYKELRPILCEYVIVVDDVDDVDDDGQ